jgi:hypothetical protein
MRQLKERILKNKTTGKSLSEAIVEILKTHYSQAIKCCIENLKNTQFMCGHEFSLYRARNNIEALLTL